MITRFAPSPTGLLHLGHAFSAWTSFQTARHAGGAFLVRIEDIDFTRCRPEFETALLEDLAWLGLTWPEPVWRQSGRFSAYEYALTRLKKLGVLYPCYCTRQEIIAAAPQGDAAPVYPGTCRVLEPARRDDLLAGGRPHAWRLDTARALRLTGPLSWQELDLGPQPANPSLLGDVILARKEVGTSYHLAVTVDDAAQGVTLVTRGVDLLDSTHIHRLLQALLGLPVPAWQHHRLILDETGKRLAKRDAARSLRSLRESGHTPDRILALFSPSGL